LGSEQNLTGIDLFSGAGGFSLAAMNAGVQIIAAVESNRHASSTYRLNFIKDKIGAPVLYEKDILELDPLSVIKNAGICPESCDIIMGGPPCQGFSSHRIKNQGVDDPRNSLLLRYFHFVGEIRPKVFIVENVPGLLWPRHKKYVDQFYGLGLKAGYKLFDPAILNAKDFGVPQNRKRVFILGIRNDVNWIGTWPPEPTHFNPISQEVVDKKKKPWKSAACVFQVELMSTDPNAIHMNHSKELIEVFRSTPKNGGSRSESGRKLSCHKNHDGHKDVYGRINPNNPGPTMTTACINPSKGRFVHPIKHQGITVRHAARFQAFPDTFSFVGGLIAAGQQVGNAVPITLGEAVIRSIVEGLCSSTKAAEKTSFDKEMVKQRRGLKLQNESGR